MKVIITEHFSDEKGNNVVEITEKVLDLNMSLRECIVEIENDEEFTIDFLNDLLDNDECEIEGWFCCNNSEGKEVYIQFEESDFLRTFQLVS